MTDVAMLSQPTLIALRDHGVDPAEVLAVVDRSIAEDLAGGVDVTSQATIPVDQVAVVDIVARGPGVVAGLPYAAAAFEAVSSGAAVCEYKAKDGQSVQPGDVVLRVVGPTRSVLTGERTALNLLGHLSGVATLTRRWVDAVAATGTKIRDTRKTTPGLRTAEKYAVRCGGGVNHRMSLSDAALIKDNHVAAAGGVTAAFDAVRSAWPGLPVEVEVDSLEQLADVVRAGADLVLLDNFAPAQMAEAVAEVAGRARLEASGGLTLASAADVAATGVDYIAVGELTHSAAVLDFGADFVEVRTDAARG